MDFRVTHFLSGTTFNYGLEGSSQVLGESVSNGAISVIDPTTGASVLDNLSGNESAIQIVQGLDTTDSIQKEMRFIKSGKIGKGKAISIKKMTMSNVSNPMVKFIGAEIDNPNWTIYSEDIDASYVIQNCSTLNLVCGQEFSLTLRAQSARANTISPFGLTKTYTRMVNCCAGCDITTFEASYNTVRQVLIDLAEDKVMSEFVKPVAIYGWFNDGDGNSSFYAPYTDGFSEVISGYSPATLGSEVLGDDFAIGLVLEGVEQVNWKNDADITLFPFRKDAVKIFAQTFVGPMAASNPHNGGTQEPLLVADMCDTGKTWTINFAFPELTFDELKHIEHQYATYSQKYGQRFQGVKYNALTFPSFLNSGTTYRLYYIEYMPSVDVSYTSTMDMTQLTIVAVPSSSSGDFESTIEAFTGLTAVSL